MHEKVTYRQQVSFCGKPSCRKCRAGTGHGPYWYAYHLTPEGRTVRTYIGRQLPPGLSTAPTAPTSSTAPVVQVGQGEQGGQHGQHGEIERLDRLLAANPADEEALRQLMSALAREKRRGEALRAYQRFATHLQQTLQGDPSNETRELYEAVQRGDDLAPLAQSKNGRSNQSPFVGREVERETLRQLLMTDSSQERSPAQCVVLMGEPGIGKTRLAEETAREALRSGWAVTWSHAYTQEMGIPYRLWSESLRNLIAQGLWNAEDAGGAGEQQVYGPLKALLPELQEIWEEDAHAYPAGYHAISPEQEQVQLREAMFALLATISKQNPLLFVMDDVQWADSSSCEMLGYLARRLAGHAIVLLATCREIELAENATLRDLLSHLQREHAVQYLHVQPLSNADIAALVVHLPRADVSRIQSQAVGNPFFAEELAYAMHADPPVLPLSITAALTSRMQRLSDPCQQLLGKAAVLGGSFGLPLICSMEAARADEDSVLDLLDEAIHSGILTEEGTGARIAYRFWHPLLATHLYTSLSAARQARLHRRAAEALQQVYLVGPDRQNRHNEQAAAITDHLVKGGADAAQIVRFAELAADYAYSLPAYPEAERHYRLAVLYLEKANGLLPETAETGDGGRLAFFLERLAECERIQGRFKEARKLFERVLEVRKAESADQLDAREAQIQALLWSEVGWTWRFTGENALAWQCCARGEQLLHEAGVASSPARARLLFLQSSLYWQEGKYDDAMRAAREALRIFEEMQPGAPPPSPARMTRIRSTLQGDPVDPGRTHALLGAIANSLGQRSLALEHLTTALALYERYGRLREIAHVCNNIGHVHLKAARYSQAEGFFQRSYALAERIGDPPLQAVVLHNQAEMANAPGSKHSPEEAETFYQRSLLMAEQIDDREYLSSWNADYALVLIQRGKLDESAACAFRSLSIARAMRNTPCTGHALVAIGTLRVAQAREAGNGEQDKQAKARASLQRARRTLERALAMHGLEDETYTAGQKVLDEVLRLERALDIPNF